MKATVQSTSHGMLTSSRSNDGRLDTGWRSAEQDHPWWAVIVGVNGLQYDLERVIVYQDLSVDCGKYRPNTNWNPDRWSGVRPAPVCVLIVLEVLMAFFRAFNCRIVYGLYLPTVILTVIWYSITHSLFLSRLKTFFLYKSFPL